MLPSKYFVLSYRWCTGANQCKELRSWACRFGPRERANVHGVRSHSNAILTPGTNARILGVGGGGVCGPWFVAAWTLLPPDFRNAADRSACAVLTSRDSWFWIAGGTWWSRQRGPWSTSRSCLTPLPCVLSVRRTPQPRETWPPSSVSLMTSTRSCAPSC